jgi:hypothetical protein
MEEGSAGQVPPDEHPSGAQRRGGGERVGGPELGRRRLVGREPEHGQRTAQPRPIGNPQQKPPS